MWGDCGDSFYLSLMNDFTAYVRTRCSDLSIVFTPQASLKLGSDHSQPLNILGCGDVVDVEVNLHVS